MKVLSIFLLFAAVIVASAADDGIASGRNNLRRRLVSKIKDGARRLFASSHQERGIPAPALRRLVPQDKVFICHRLNKKSDDFIKIKVSGNAKDKHLAHGDFLWHVGLDDNCEQTPTQKSPTMSPTLSPTLVSLLRGS